MVYIRRNGIYFEINCNQLVAIKYVAGRTGGHAALRCGVRANWGTPSDGATLLRGVGPAPDAPISHSGI